MAILIDIKRTKSVAHELYYKYWNRDEEVFGELSINEKTGVVTIYKYHPEEKNEQMSLAVAYKLKKHWESGIIPDKTMWAS
ncbi:hypothetical protein [Woodsholea maritima]|uniref:hypothetical protein n=1 Tax=Woodsholea maritima TaxID=240237 RepID=UPI0003606C82|nr:hypothetical protein [Woodsholea maritima]